MFQLISRKIKTVTPEAAGSFLESNQYDGQRNLREKHVTMLKEAIESKRFHVGHIALAHQGWNGGGLLLANGQHQCEAIILAGLPISAVVEEYECKTAEDFAVLYRQFDNNASRSLSEIALPEVRALKLKWSRKLIQTILAGVAFIEGHTGVHKNKRIEYLKRYVKEGGFIYDTLSPVTYPEYRHLGRGPVVAAMIVTFRKCAADAEVFWENVRDGENLKGNSPALRLRNYLLSTSVGVGRGVNAPSLNTAASYREMYGKCIVAWNAYRRNDTTQLKFYADKEIPKPV